MNMNPQNETLIERYLSGAMSASERRNFLDSAERDPNLKRHLQAEQVIASAVRHDRAAMPAPSAGSRAQFISMLATISGEEAPAPGSSSSGSTGSGGSSPLRYLPGSGRMRGVAAVIAGAALVVGAVLFTPRANAPQPVREPAARAASAPAPAQVVTAPPSATQPATVAAPAAEAPANQPAVTESATTGQPASRIAPALESRSQKQIARDDRAQARRRTNPTASAASDRNSKPSTNPQTINDPIHGTVHNNQPTVIK